MTFYKYDGAGNDFVIMDIRQNDPNLTTAQIERICHRRFGVGADGLITLGNAAQPYDFEMRYYNSDGKLGSMCGNGGRCIAAFAHSLGLGHIDRQSGLKVLDFIGFDGPHHAEIMVWHLTEHFGLVKLQMRDIKTDSVSRCLDGWFLDTGSPHYVQRVEGLEKYDVVGEGRRLRNMLDIFPEGTNVDFIEDLADGRLFVRTYERGVEDETYACGTGVTACAIVSGNNNIVTRGGDFKVTFDPTGSEYRNVQLIGPVSFNFKGELDNFES